MTTIVSMNSVFKDLYPLPGTRIKQWVVEWREAAAWRRATCPVVAVADHLDNTSVRCINLGPTQWCDLDHHACHYCNDLQDARAGDLDIAAWRIELSQRPKPTTDREALSDQIAAESRSNPWFSR